MGRTMKKIVSIITVMAVLFAIVQVNMKYTKGQTEIKWKEVALGNSHSAAILENGDLYCWGHNNCGQVGDGTTTERDTPVKIMSNVKEVALGNSHSAAITENGDLYCWGYDSCGQLGDGSTTNKNTPVKIMSNVKEVSLGFQHSAAIKENGDLYCWGYDSCGQLGDGSTTNKNTPVKIMSNVKEVSLGGYHSAAITTNGDLYCWGWNGYGLIGDGSTTNKNTPVKIMSNVKEVSLGWYHSAAIKENGDLYCWGDNSEGQLGDGSTTNKNTPVKIMSNVKEVSLYYYDSAAIKENGDLYCWGYDSCGQLGDGSTTNKNTPVKIMSNVKEVSLGGYHSAAIKENGDLYCWGDNSEGQLGDGTTTERRTPVKITINNDISTDYKSVLGDSQKIEGVINSFTTFKNVSNQPYNNIIPGLSETAAYEVDSNKLSACTNMTPQGVCVTNKYILISAYCNHSDKNKSKCKKKHKSVIYVLNKNTGKYLTTLNLETDSHVGGLAYDSSGLLYVADSSNNLIWAINEWEINSKVALGENHIKISFNMNKTFSTKQHNPSFITYYGGYIYVGNCVQNDLNKWSSYMIPFDMNHQPLENKKIYLPVKAQGASIVEDKNGNNTVIASCSLGRNNIGHFYTYSMLRGSDALLVSALVKNIDVPNMCEDIFANNNKIYTCFESAANIYRNGTDGSGNSSNQIDRIIVSDAQKLIEKTSLLRSSGIVQQISEDDEIISGSCGENLNYTLYSDGTLMVSDFGDMNETDTMPWDDYKAQIQKVVIGADVTSISNNAFANCTNLKELIFSNISNDSDFKIGANAFKNCTSLKNISLSEGKYDINRTAFEGVSSTCVLKSDDDSISETSNELGLTAHIHNYKYQNTATPSCGTSGYDLYQCDCGKTEARNQKEPTLEHHFILIDNDKKIYKCDDCGLTLQNDDLLEEKTTTTNTSSEKTSTVMPVTNKPLTTKKSYAGIAVKKVQTKKKALKVSWKKVKGVSGYKLQYSTKKNFKKAKTLIIKKANTTSKLIKRLKKKKKYYVRICTFKKIKGKTYFSAWSKPKNKKTK